MSKYDPLKEFLQNSNKTTEILTFQEVEKILGFPLPPSASKHRAWWDYAKTHTHTLAWLEAGWKVESVSLGFQVTFSKNTNEKSRERTQEREKTQEQKRPDEQKKSYTTPQEIFAYFNCPYPCDAKQLKNAHREMVKQYHPDKLATMGLELRGLAEKKTKEINGMYEKAVSYLKRLFYNE